MTYCRSGRKKIDSASFCGETGGEKQIHFCKSVAVGLGGGNGTSKAGAGSRSGGSGEVYNKQAGGQVRRIEECESKGGKRADSSEDVGGMVGVAGSGIEHDGIDKSHVHILAS